MFTFFTIYRYLRKGLTRKLKYNQVTNGCITNNRKNIVEHRQENKQPERLTISRLSIGDPLCKITI